MTVRDRIEEILIRNKLLGFCDDCLATLLGLTTRQQANQQSRELEKRQSEYARAVGECNECKSTHKKVIRAL